MPADWYESGAVGMGEMMMPLAPLHLPALSFERTIKGGVLDHETLILVDLNTTKVTLSFQMGKKKHENVSKKEGEEKKTTSDLIFHSSEVEKISSEVDVRARVGCRKISFSLFPLLMDRPSL